MRRLVAGGFNGHSAVCSATPWLKPGVRTVGDVHTSGAQSQAVLFFSCVKKPSDKMQFIKKTPPLFISFALLTEPLRLGVVCVIIVTKLRVCKCNVN
jgi:hypothetical protein